MNNLKNKAFTYTIADYYEGVCEYETAIPLKDVKEALDDFDLCLTFHRWGFDGLGVLDLRRLNEQYGIDFDKFVIEEAYNKIFGDFEK